MPRRLADLPEPFRREAGGKAAMLARLVESGYPVPDGLAILSGEFEGDELGPEAKRQLLEQVDGWLGDGRVDRLAVRSSALAEDAPDASFAGAFDSVLGVASADDLIEAIGRVRRSGHGARVESYGTAKGAAAEHEVAVIVQRQVRPDFAGVLFTADPVTGDLMTMKGNVTRGLGEKLVSGEVTGEAFSVDRQTGRYQGPGELKKAVRRLCRLAERLDRELGYSVDIEWAVAGGKVWILQARPIASMREFNPVTGELNSSLLGDFLWSNGNAAEIQPEVMTLLTWSLTKLWGDGYGTWWSRYPASGAIGGRSYFNISIQVAPFARLPGGKATAIRYVGDWWGRIPAGVTIPMAPFSRREVMFKVLPMFLGSNRRFARLRAQIPGFIEKAPGWCRQMRERIKTTGGAAELAALWREEIRPFYCFGTAMASAANLTERPRLEKELIKLVGDEDANALLSNLGGDGCLASVRPLVALAHVARGEMSREAYLEQFGHRGPYEFELSRPQPIDEPGWLDARLADFRQQPFDADALLERQRSVSQAAWKRLADKYPGKAGSLRRRIDEVGRLSGQREAARSEVTRIVGVARAWALRAGEAAGVGEDVSHLTLDELVAALDGDPSAARFIPKRMETYARYRALPSYPPVISGRFDPFAWAAEAARRTDVFDAHVALPLRDGEVVIGFPGACGVVEGVVRRIDRFEDGRQLRAGEILLTTTTNVGWTPLFPRAAAIVTDVGAPLSHAAIVARELGIPAVVGCTDATMRLRTGDRVRVDGARGRVEILARGK